MAAVNAAVPKAAKKLKPFFFVWFNENLAPGPKARPKEKV